MSADPKAWARKIVAEFQAGTCTKSIYSIRVAHEVLGLPVPQGFK